MTAPDSMCQSLPMTNTPTITLQCADDHDVTFPATITSGNVSCPVEGCDSHADVSHAYRHVGWCTVCGDTDCQAVQIDGDTDPSDVVGMRVLVGTVESLECTRPVVRFDDGRWTYGTSHLCLA